jgi:malonate-semialdehyde dehydrogenase (acetylating)/methylmalonate-semialdehyde dehydrogenase
MAQVLNFRSLEPESESVQELSHFIGGKAVAGSSGRFGVVYNPATGQVVKRVSFASTGEVNAAVQRQFPVSGFQFPVPERLASRLAEARNWKGLQR